MSSLTGWTSGRESIHIRPMRGRRWRLLTNKRWPVTDPSPRRDREIGDRLNKPIWITSPLVVIAGRYRPGPTGRSGRETAVAAGGAALRQQRHRRLAQPPRILAHYMPWYMARPHSQIWGWHWTMGTFDPEGRKGGQPTIASHYHPIIGPYDSADPDVIEYHALLMKLAGIDGVVIDWYGTVDYLDYADEPPQHARRS